MASQDQDESQKTEEPTPRRIQKARSEGQVPQSREINTWLILLIGTVFIAGPASGMVLNLNIYARSFFENAALFPFSPKELENMMRDIYRHLAIVVLLPMIGLSFIMVGSGLSQIGPLLAPKKIQPKLQNISLLNGVKRLFSLRSLVEFAKGLFKISIVGLVGYVLSSSEFGRIDSLPFSDVSDILPITATLFVKLMIGVLAFLLAATIADTFYQRYEHFKNLRMTRQEVRDELKESEGDPQIKARIRRLRAERARQRLIQSIPQADVIVTNPTHYSVALQYEPTTMEAPYVTAKGIDDAALRIREIATNHDVPLVENPPLARALYAAYDVDEAVSDEHFQAVAEVISYVWRLRNKTIQ